MSEVAFRNIEFKEDWSGTKTKNIQRKSEVLTSIYSFVLRTDEEKEKGTRKEFPSFEKMR